MSEVTAGSVIPPPPPPNAVSWPGVPTPPVVPGTPMPPPGSAGLIAPITPQAPAPPADAAEAPRRRRRTRAQIEADNANGAAPVAPVVTQAMLDEATPPELRPQTEPPPVPQELHVGRIMIPVEGEAEILEGNAKPKFWVSVGSTINIGNYESMKLDMGVSGIDYDADSDEIERIMASANVGIHETVEVLLGKIVDRAIEIKTARGIPLGNG